MWTLSVANGIRVFDEHGNEVHITARKAQGLLVYLCLGSDGKVDRGKLCGMLWSERPEATARASLRQCIKRLSADLGPNRDKILEVNRSEIRLVSRPKLDLENICERIIQGEQRVGVLNPEEFFSGIDDLDPNFSSGYGLSAKFGLRGLKPNLTKSTSTKPFHRKSDCEQRELNSNWIAAMSERLES